MARPKRKRKKPGQPGRAVTNDPATLLGELDDLASRLESTDPAGHGPVWGSVHKLLLRARVDPAESGRLIATRDAAGLRRLLRKLHGEIVEDSEPPAPTDDIPEIPLDTMKKAMRAFRKRLKLTRLDHESRLGVGPMTGGRKADFDAILPPHEFPREVWEALAADGQLVRAGQGFYMLAEDA